jgi:methyl-accepting chemotaxis protein
MTTNDAEKSRKSSNRPQARRSGSAGVRLRNRLRLFVILIICIYGIYSLALLLQITDPPATPADPDIRPRLSSPGGADHPDRAGGGLTPQQQRWLAIGSLLTLVLLAATYFYTRNLLAPLEDIRVAVARIARGRLDRSIAVREKDEIGAIAECINDIAANQQEILLHMWNQTGHSITLLERIAAGIVDACPNDGTARIQRDLTSVRNSMEGLRALTGDVGFFQVDLRDGKVHAAENPPATDAGRPKDAAADGHPRMGAGIADGSPKGDDYV